MFKGFLLSQVLTNFPPSKWFHILMSIHQSYPKCMPLFAQQLATSEEQGQVNVAF